MDIYDSADELRWAKAYLARTEERLADRSNRYSAYDIKIAESLRRSFDILDDPSACPHHREDALNDIIGARTVDYDQRIAVADGMRQWVMKQLASLAKQEHLARRRGMILSPESKQVKIKLLAAAKCLSSQPSYLGATQHDEEIDRICQEMDRLATRTTANR